MSSTIQAAWIAAASGFLGVLVGVSGTVTVAIFGFRSTRDATAAAVSAGTADLTAQIEADRRNRIWEKQAAAYTDAIAGVLHRQRVRQGQWQGLVTGTQPTASAPPVNWQELEGRLVAYSSPAVLAALREAATAGEGFESAVGMWVAARTTAQTLGSSTAGPSPADARQSAEGALTKATGLDDRLMDLIREELHSSATRVPDPPVPLSRPFERT